MSKKSNKAKFKKSGPNLDQTQVSLNNRLAELEASLKNNPSSIQAALELCEFYARSQNETKITSVLSPLGLDYPFDSPEQALAFNRLMALGYAHEDKLIEAEDVLKRAEADQQTSLDLDFVRAFVALNMREFDRVIQSGQAYQERIEQLQAESSRENSYSATGAHASQLSNFIGVAYKETGQLEKAAESFNKAIGFDPGNHLPHLNLVHALNHLKKNDEAKQIVEHGLKSCRQIQELRLLAEALQSKATVSACMIVKNEEELLSGCLESIRDWVDEIIIVDTGSTDQTVEIAHKYGAQVLHQEWEDNFSKHRNFSLDQATCDWVFIIDADERFHQDHLNRLRPLLNNEEMGVISINVYNLYNRVDERSMSFLPSIRFFRRELNLRYDGIVHNVLRIPEGTTVYRADIRLDHLGYDLSKEKMANKAKRTGDLLKKQLEENPDNAFALFNLAQLYCGQREEDVTAHAAEILELAGRAVKLTSPDENDLRHIHMMCLNQIAWTHFFTRNYEQAHEYASRALEDKPDYLDPLLLRGHIEAQQNHLDEAEKYYKEYLKVQAAYDAGQETDNMIITHVDSRVNAVYGLGMIAELKGDLKTAQQRYRETIELFPTFLEANAHLGRLLLGDNKAEEAEKYFRFQVEHGQFSRTALGSLARMSSGREDWTGSENYWRQILVNDPEDSEAIKELAAVYRQQGRHDQATAMLEQLGETEDNESLQLMADMLFEAGKFAEAADRYSQLLKEASEPSSSIFNNLGNCYFKLADFRKASQQYRQAIETEPVAVEAYRNLALAEARLGKNLEGAEYLIKYMELEPGQTGLSSLVGDLLAAGGDFQRALGFYEQSLRSNPNDIKVLYQISECYLNLGHHASALTGFERIAAVAPEFEAARTRIEELKKPTPVN